MKEVLPVVIGCIVGIFICLGYLMFLLVKSIRKKYPKKAETFDFDENTLTIDITKRKK